MFRYEINLHIVAFMSVDARDEDEARELARQEFKLHITDEIKYEISEYETYEVWQKVEGAKQ